MRKSELLEHSLHQHAIRTMVEVLKNVLAALFLLCGFLVTLGNYSLIIKYSYTGKHGSLVPLFGGAMGAAGCLISTNAILNRYWWAPLLIDPGSALMIGGTLCWLAKEWLHDKWKRFKS